MESKQEINANNALFVSASSTVVLTKDCSATEKYYMSYPEIVDGDSKTCVLIPNTTHSMVLRVYDNIHGVTLTTLVTSKTFCIPPQGIFISVAQCDVYENCNILSYCYLFGDTLSDSCLFYCKLQSNIQGNAFIVNLNFRNDFKLCEIKF